MASNCVCFLLWLGSGRKVRRPSTSMCLLISGPFWTGAHFSEQVYIWLVWNKTCCVKVKVPSQADYGFASIPPQLFSNVFGHNMHNSFLVDFKESAFLHWKYCVKITKSQKCQLRLNGKSNLYKFDITGLAFCIFNWISSMAIGHVVDAYGHCQKLQFLP